MACFYSALDNMDGGGTVNNHDGGTITGQSYGIFTQDGYVGVTNAGTIEGSDDAGIYFTDSGAVIGNEGSITGETYGVHIENGGTVANNGVISGNTAQGIYLIEDGGITNQSEGVVSGGTDGIRFGGTAALINAGSITGAAGAAVTVGGSGTITNTSSGVMSGAVRGLEILGGTGTVTNSGSISGGTDDGIYLGSGGSVDNRAGATIAGTVRVEGGLATLINAGEISDALDAVTLIDGGSVDNAADGVISGTNRGVYMITTSGDISNAGIINGTNNEGVLLAAGGTVENMAGGVISGGTFSARFLDQTTFTNAGTLNGDVQFGTTDDTLNLRSGSIINGNVDGGDGTDQLVVTGDLDLGTITNFELATIKNGTVNWNDESINLTNLTIDNANLSFAGAAQNIVAIDGTSTLSGTGTFAGLVISGVVAPGNSAGTLTVVNDYTMDAGATYDTEIYGDGSGDLIDVGGAATLDGVLSIDIADAADAYAEDGTYTILTSVGGITGDFSTVTASGGTATVYAMHEVSSNDVNVNIINPTEFFAGAGGTANEVAAASVIAGVAVETSEAQSLFYTDAATINETLEQLSGSSHATMANIVTTDGNEYMNAVMSESRNDNGDGAVSWMKLYGNGGTATTDGNARGYEQDTKGVAVGLGYAVSPELTVGLHGGHSWSDATFGTDVGKATTKEFGAYAVGQVNDFKFSAVYSHGWSDVGMSRSITLAGTAQNNASLSTNKIQLEASFAIKADQLTIEPVIGYNRAVVGGILVAETGAGAANLNGETNKFTSSQPRGGVRLSFDAYTGTEGTLTPSAQVMYVSEQGDLNGALIVSSEGVPGTSFTSTGLVMEKNRFEVDAGVDYKTSGNISFNVSYRGTYMKTIKSHGARAGIKVRF